jgi:glyoxylase-like metal-dependent hydrolase (beta-lactamase superfamily II)
MNIHLIETPEFKIDGGAYFGVVPKMIWEKKYPEDKNNMCPASCRSLLIKEPGRLILIDNGIGEKLDNGTQDGYFVDFSQNLIANIKKIGYSPDDITDVVLTHLHFDHCGGTTFTDSKTGKQVPVFKNANYYISKKQWDNALEPNYREQSSYNPEKFIFLKDTNKIRLVKQNLYLSSNIELRLFDGHTPGLMLPIIKTKERTLFFTGDLIPAMASIPLSWISAYDLFPLTSIEEKQKILDEAIKNNWILVFQHDYFNECCDLKLSPRGIRSNNVYKFTELF